VKETIRIFLKIPVILLVIYTEKNSVITQKDREEDLKII